MLLLMLSAPECEASHVLVFPAVIGLASIRRRLLHNLKTRLLRSSSKFSPCTFGRRLDVTESRDNKYVISNTPWDTHKLCTGSLAHATMSVVSKSISDFASPQGRVLSQTVAIGSLVCSPCSKNELIGVC